jgi:hypothetical protein
MKSSVLAFVAAALLMPALASAQHITITPVVKAIAADEAAAAVAAGDAAAAITGNDASAKQTPAPPPPFVYRDADHTRLKIHKLASFTMLPLFAAEGVVGKMLYDNPTDSRRSVHNGIALGIGGLFAVNSITGTWNLIESRKDPNGRTKRIIHSVLMLASDAGFLATAMSTPSSRHRSLTYVDDRTKHRNLAIASISSATIGYVIMLFK